MHIRRVDVHVCVCVPHVRHARMEEESSVLVIVGWENMAREISDSGFMRASSRGERRISILTFLRSHVRERRSRASERAGERDEGGGRERVLHGTTTTEFL